MRFLFKTVAVLFVFLLLALLVHLNFQEKDLNNNPSDCKALISDFNDASSVDIYKSKFKQCEAEINDKMIGICSHTKDLAIEYLNKGMDLASNKSSYSIVSLLACDENIGESVLFKKVHSRYELPSVDNKFIVLPDHQTMLSPDSIQKISFKQVFDNLYSLTIYLKNTKNDTDSYILYFGEIELWNKAKSDFSLRSRKYD